MPPDEAPYRFASVKTPCRAGGEAFAAFGDSAMDFCDQIDNAEVRDQCYLEVARNISCPGGWYTATEEDFHVEQCFSSNTDRSEGGRDADTGGGNSAGGGSDG